MKEKIFLDKRIIDQRWCLVGRGDAELVKGVALIIQFQDDVTSICLSAEELYKAAALVELPESI
jgi:hypothetical protein